MSQALWHYALESQRGGEGRLGSVCTARACRMNSCLRTPSDGSGVPETRRIQHIARGYASITRYCVPPMPRGSVFVFFSAGRPQSREISHSVALVHKCHSHYSKIGHKTAANIQHIARGYASITRYCVPPMPRGSVFVFSGARRAESCDISC